METQLTNVYNLLCKKQSITESLLSKWIKIDNFLLKSEGCDLKNYISKLSGSDEEILVKINSVGKKFWGGLNDEDRNIMFGFYLLTKGRIRKNDHTSLVRDLHETLLSIISLCIQSKSGLKGRLVILNSDLENYSRTLKDTDNLMCLVDRQNMALTITKEDDIDKILEKKVKTLLDKPDALQFIVHALNKFGISIKKMAYYSILVIMFLTQSYNQVQASNPSGPTPVSTSSTAAKNVSFNPIFPTDTKYTITALYGKRIISKGSKDHKGIDVGCQAGTQVQAVADGIVTVKNDPSGYGLYITINHGSVQSLYAHLSRVKFKTGDFVKVGQVIALSGASGHIQGPHLHFEIIKDDNKIDPMPFFGSDIIAQVKLKTETISWAQKAAYASYQKLIPPSTASILRYVEPSPVSVDLKTLNPSIFKKL